MIEESKTNPEAIKDSQSIPLNVTFNCDHLDDALSELTPVVQDLDDTFNDTNQHTIVDERYTQPLDCSPEKSKDQWIGKQFNGYEILELLGMGGNGRVYRARHICLEMEVAIKFIYGVSTDNKKAMGRFQREAISSARFAHPNLVRATDAGIQGETIFLVTELIRGSDLTHIVKQRGQLSLEMVSSIACKAASGLAELKRHNTVHRDIKPSNIMLDETGEIKILDLGLACTSNSTNHTYTETGQVMGTVDFIAPEQAADATNVDTSADIYSLGCTLFYLLAGSAPFHSKETLTAKLIAHIEEIADSITTYRTDIPPAIETFLRRMMAKETTDRPSPEQVQNVFAQFANDHALAELMNLENAGKPIQRAFVVSKFDSTTSSNSAMSAALETIGLIEKETSQSTGIASYKFSYRWLLAAIPFATTFGMVYYFSTSKPDQATEVLTEDQAIASVLIAEEEAEKAKMREAIELLQSEALVTQQLQADNAQLKASLDAKNQPKPRPKRKASPKKRTVRYPVHRKPTTQVIKTVPTKKTKTKTTKQPPTFNQPNAGQQIPGFPPPGFPPPGFPPPPNHKAPPRR